MQKGIIEYKNKIIRVCSNKDNLSLKCDNNIIYDYPCDWHKQLLQYCYSTTPIKLFHSNANINPILLFMPLTLITELNKQKMPSEDMFKYLFKACVVNGLNCSDVLSPFKCLMTDTKFNNTVNNKSLWHLLEDRIYKTMFPEFKTITMYYIKTIKQKN